MILGGDVDYATTVFVDGDKVAFHEGLFAPFEIDVAGGEHLVAVVLHPAPESEPQASPPWARTGAPLEPHAIHLHPP